MQFIAAAVLNPAGEAGGNQFAQDLSSSPGFQSAPVLQLRQELLNDVVHLIKQRLHLQYDADVEQQNISGDGVSVHGGQILYDRVPPNDPTQWQRIDNPEMFQAAMAHLVEEAVQNTRRKAASMGGKTAVNQQAVRYLADHLKQHIGNPDFANQTAIRFNAYKGKGNAVDPFNLPWKRVGGEFPTAVMGHYGSTFLSASNISPVNSDGVAADGNNSTQTGKPDASTMLYSVLNAQVSMSTELQSKAKAQKSEFYAPLWNEGAKHVYSVIPTEMAEVWRHDDPTKNLTPQQWVDKHLVQPAQAYLDQKRTTPQLHGLLKSICVPMNLPAADMDRIYRNISAKSEFRGGQQVYNLRDVHEALSQQCARYANADQWRDWMQTELAHQVPPSPGMTKRIGDTNWEDAKGSPTYLGVKHNPFTNKIEANFIDDKGNITGPVAENWLFGKQFLGTPLAQRNS